jgi:hypothetical protein
MTGQYKKKRFNDRKCQTHTKKEKKWQLLYVGSYIVCHGQSVKVRSAKVHSALVIGTQKKEEKKW